MDRHSGADRGRHGFFDDVGRLTSACVFGRVLDCSTFDASNAGRDANHHTRLGEAALMNAMDKVTKHLFADVEIGDDPVFQRTDGLDVLRGPPEHALGFETYGQRAAVSGVHRDHRRLVQDDTAPAFVDQGVGGAKVDRQVSSDKGAHA